MPRMAFHKGTAAALAGKVFALAEPVWETDTKILRVGDGVNTVANLPTVGSRTEHDAIRWFAGDRKFDGTATYVPNNTTLNVVPYWSFANAAENFLKWCWQPDSWWGTYTIRMGFVFPGVEALDNTRWRYSEERIVVNANEAGGGSVIVAPAQVALTTATPPAAGLGTANRYLDIATGVTAVAPLNFVVSTLERLGNDGADPFTGAAGVYLITATRVT